MTKKNREVAKYRVWGMVIIIVSLFVLSFGILLFQEQLQLTSLVQQGVISR